MDFGGCVDRIWVHTLLGMSPICLKCMSGRAGCDVLVVVLLVVLLRGDRAREHHTGQRAKSQDRLAGKKQGSKLKALFSKQQAILCGAAGPMMVAMVAPSRLASKRTISSLPRNGAARLFHVGRTCSSQLTYCRPCRR